MNGGACDCRARATADMAGGPATGGDATDHFVRTPAGLPKSVLFDEKEHQVGKDRLGDRKSRVVKYGDGRSKPRLSALKSLCRLSRAAGIGTPFQSFPIPPLLVEQGGRHAAKPV